MLPASENSSQHWHWSFHHSKPRATACMPPPERAGDPPTWVAYVWAFCFVCILFGNAPHFPFLWACPRAWCFCCFFHSSCHINHCWESQVMVLCVCTLFSCHTTHLSDPVGSVRAFVLCSPPWLDKCIHWFPLHWIPKMELSLWSSCWLFLFQIGLQWKGRLLIFSFSNNTATI